MSDKNLVNVQIPAEEVENIDELVRDGYYGNRSVAIRDIIRRGAAHLRLGFRSVKPKEEDKKTRRNGVHEDFYAVSRGRGRKY